MLKYTGTEASKYFQYKLDDQGFKIPMVDEKGCAVMDKRGAVKFQRVASNYRKTKRKIPLVPVIIPVQQRQASVKEDFDSDGCIFKD